MSPRNTNAPPKKKKTNGHSTPAVDPQTQIIQNLRAGVMWANELGRMLNQTEASEWRKEKMVVAALTYAAAMANNTNLDEDDWMELALTSYRGVRVE